MSVVGISETKYLILHSGRAVPGEGEKVERNEGVLC